MSIYEMSLQNVADQLLGMVSGSPPSEERERAFAAIRHLERRMWHQGMFADAMTRVWPGRFVDTSDGRLTYEPATDSLVELPEAVGRLVVEYSILVMPDELPEEPLYDTEEAAVYLNVSVDTIKKYVHRTHILIGEKKGNSLVFRKSELDAIEDKIKRGRGRPREQASQE